ncbi:MAG: DUF1538 domain-containing protein [Clostridia bacterium]|nr:DUF1538 domain-containing protein [Clostridia bacterium]
MKEALKEKFKEAFQSVFPIALIVLALSATFAPLKSGTFVLFLIGVVMLVAGTAFFTLGADHSMLVIGQKVGSTLTKTKKVWLISFISFVIGFIVTMAEPDLQILADQVPAVDSEILIAAVSAGVGIFLTLAMLRIVFGISLSIILAVFYAAAFVLALVFVPSDFWALSFDSGGVTTGPVTVPFIMSLGVGVAAVRSGKKSGNDSFGLVALSSIGPILAVLILGIVYKVEGGAYEIAVNKVPDTTRNAFVHYGHGLGEYALEVGKALLPIIAFFVLFQLVTRAFHRRQLIRVIFGLLFTFVGLTVFLTGANVGFLPVGSQLGQTLAGLWGGWLLVPVGMLLGYFVVSAEPAVHVLNKQVERMSAGAVTASAMKKGLCIGVCAAIGFAMLRILLGFNVMWILLPGYAVALVLTIFTPKLFTGIAFDSGGVASGAMVSSFVLPMAIGACSVIAPAEIMTLAFGCVALVALAPLISIQLLGIHYRHKTATYKKNFLSEEDGIVEYEVD